MKPKTVESYLEKKKVEAAEIAEILNKVPEGKRERVLGIIEGAAIEVKDEKKAG